ncbi:unnamed protein product [Rhizoctonia solani]|uniref:Uncharacterized protein n=1 Tax=Rhizoctonia solani TaxID=456999 RepID=A0A8H3DP52_9AGAM|nr:unnamed protein product [Rhizoctonia solani]CAE6532574.1 unnamed protein product [Rhizoctonia solani]
MRLQKIASGHASEMMTSADLHCITKWSDGLRARFPLGTENIICGAYYDKTYRSCSTIFDSLGNMISREIYSSTDIWWAVWFYSTRYAIYYTEDDIPKWEGHDPVWIQKLSSQCSESQDAPLAPIRPIGMHNHEIRMYRDLPWRGDTFSMLLWKSSRNGETPVG